MTSRAPAEAATWKLVSAEVTHVLDQIDPAEFIKLGHLFEDTSRRWFFTGQGRSGLVAEMAAMRVMHLGFDTHVLGESTAPSVRAGDVLFIISNSGTTPVSISFANIARAQGATVALLTSNPASPLASLADHVLTLPSAGSKQFGGSLFEQASLLALDAIVLHVCGNDPESYERMSHRHTNMQ